MSHDSNITLELVKETHVRIQEDPAEFTVKDIVSSLPATVAIPTDADTNFDIIIDLESMGIDPPDPSGTTGRIHRIILFTKSVLGRKTTFGRSSLGLVNNIQTIGTADIDPANHNLVTRQFIFGKAVSAKKTTFGRLSLGLVDNIQTAGINSMGQGSGYGSGLYGFGIYVGGMITLPIKFGSVISGAVLVKQTAVAEVSLASHGAPASGANHTIKVRARTVSGSTGVIKAALYEGAVNRSGDLSTPLLTNTFADYDIHIPTDAADTITSYSNLSIRFWGYDSAGNALAFQVSRIYLELPIVTGNTQYGAISRVTTFNRTVAGTINNKKTATAEIRLADHDIPIERTNHTIRLRARTVSGSTGVLKAALYEGAVNRSGDLITTPLTNALADYALVIPDHLAATITDYANLSIRFWGFDAAGNALVFQVANIYLELPVSSGNTTKYGVISRVITFTRVVSGVVDSGPVTYYGAVVRPITFTKAVSGFATHFAAISRATTFTKEVTGKATIKGAIARPITFTKAVSGFISSKRTATAEISLASHGTPSERTNHSIKVRARTTSGSTGVIKAELYEGSTLRSGATPLTTTALTNSLADYSLAIPDASAATITSYSNLSIKFWGYDSAGNALVFEVARIYLELPTP